MIFRATALSLALLFGIGALIPLATHFTKASEAISTTHKKKHKKYKKYSKNWWRAYHNRMRKRKAIEARKRSLRLRRIRNNARKVNVKTNNQPFANAAPGIQADGLFILVQGKIKNVFDGDNFSIESTDGKVYFVRMLGIDAPEMDENFGSKSRKKLRRLLLGKDATVIIRKMDSLKIFVGTVYSGGKDINFAQIENGMARYFRQNGYEPINSDRETYEKAEQDARQKRVGLWRRQKSKNTVAFNR